MRHLVDEALHVDGVLVGVDAAPEAHRHMRVAHRVVDQQVGDRGVAELLLGPALERRAIDAVLHALRREVGQDRLPRQPRMQRHHVAVAIQPRAQPALRDRPVEVVRHILLARPDQLHRTPGNLFRDQHGLARVVLLAAPAETTAEMQLVHLHIGQLHAGRLGRRGKRGVAILRRHPDLHLAVGELRRAVHRLHRGVGEERRGIVRLHHLRRAGECCLHIAVLLAERRLLRVEAGLQQGRDLRAVHGGAGALVPHDRQRGERGLRLVPLVGHHRDRVVVHRDDLPHARHRFDLVGIEGFQRAAEHRALRDRRVQHVGQLHVDREYLLAGQLLDRIQPLHALADDRPLRRRLQLHLGRHRQLRRIGGDLAVAQRPAARRMGDHAVRRRAFRRRHIPPLRRRRDQHGASRRAALAHIVHRAADAAAAAGGHVAPGALGGEIGIGRNILGAHMLPVGVEFIGDELREAGERALAHLRAGNAHDGGVVGADHHPDAKFLAAALRQCGAAGNAPAQREAAADGSDRTKERTATKCQSVAHGSAPYALPPSEAAVWIASRMR